MNSEIDHLFAKYTENHINNRLGPDMMKKIKNRLNEKGYSLTQAVREFDLFDKVLREFFGKGTDGMLKKIFNEIFEVKKGKHDKEKIFVIKDKKLLELILLSYANQEKKAILESVSESALSISDILDITKISQSTGYRIISSLINDGLLIETKSTSENSDDRKVSLYKSTISLIDIKIKKSIIVMEVHFSNAIVANSRIIESILQLSPNMRI